MINFDGGDYCKRRDDIGLQKGGKGTKFEISSTQGAELTDDSGLQVYEHSTGDVLPCAGFAEEGVERVIASSDGLVRRHLPVRLNTVLQTVELPAGVANLHTSLANMDGDTLALQ